MTLQRALYAEPDAAAKPAGIGWQGFARVLGAPVTQGSKRIGMVGKNGKAMIIDDHRQKGLLQTWRREMQAAMAETAPPALIDEALYVVVHVYVKRPQAHFGTGKNAGVLKPNAPKHPKSGRDLDKIQRSVGDAGTGVWWTDDQRITRWGVLRQYADVEAVEVHAKELR